ncbi:MULTISPECIES: PAS domain S-box protein [unclassified Peribacillus]|uniref:PAS domain S-box protein n=1 Tax=unclassified Peribacillus TaxID=2675266 RepID=UPI001914360D|nr:MULTISPECIES: PAS domain S-box protein [unclassified Peribacillus]MBK5463178.1 PAS domain S-box protein [Peribacillus sp. TH27]WMX53643.1 PAS domain S-box protein [Peribacillus sp. R9-11]
MEQSIVSFNPILFMIAVLLVFMACYTALDLLTTLITIVKYKRLLYVGSICSMGVAIWTLNFVVIFTFENTGMASYNFASIMLSLAIGVVLAGVGLLAISYKQQLLQMIFCSFMFTMAILSNYIMGMFVLNNSVQFNPLLLVITLLIIFSLFLISLLVLFYINKVSQSSLKPVSTLIMSAAIIEGYFLFLRVFPVTGEKEKNEFVQLSPFILYLVSFVSLFILASLIGSSTIVGRRLAKSDSTVSDIRYALDQSSIVAITDAEGIITYVNEKFIEISQYEEHELIGKSHSIINSGYHPQEFFADLWCTIKQGKTWNGEICNRAKDGEIYWVDTTIVPFMKKGKPYQYISIRSDISRRKRAESDLRVSIKELEDMYYAINQSSIVAITDEKGIIVDVNDKFSEVSGYKRSELIGHTHQLVNSGYHSKEFFDDMWKTIQNRKVWNGEIRNRAKDGSYYWVDTTIVPFYTVEGKPFQFLALRYDITERKQTEEMLHRQDKLAAVGQLAAGVAHEIRNPLTSMKGYTEYLQLDEKDENRLEYLGIIMDEINRVNEIVEEFLELSKPQSLILETKNIVPIIQNVLSLTEFDARKKNVILFFDCYHEEILIRCDENRLKQVLLNFVINGIEAMPDGGEIKVVTELKEEKVHISIIDTGVGMPPDQLRRIGEPFFTTKKSGNGLGLMISFKIIESHLGRVFVESEVNKGTVFNIVLPMEIVKDFSNDGIEKVGLV